MKRLLLPLGLVVIVGVYFGISAVLYTPLSSVDPRCGGDFAAPPARFSAEPLESGLDTAPYGMPDFQAVEIAKRDPRIFVNAWFMPSGQADAPAVLITHGLGAGASDCKRNPRALIMAGMLHRGGFNTLLLDVREHGDSTVENSKTAIRRIEQQHE